MLHFSRKLCSFESLWLVIGSFLYFRNKANFEKRQQKTNANIQQMQRKLDKYQKNLKVGSALFEYFRTLYVVLLHVRCVVS